MAVCRDHVQKDVEDPAGELATLHCKRQSLVLIALKKYIPFWLEYFSSLHHLLTVTILKGTPSIFTGKIATSH